MWSSVVILSALLVTCYGQSVAHPDGTSNSFRQFADSGTFNFGYDVVRADGSKNSRQESGDVEGNRVGSYSLTDHDGRVRVVDYTAGKEGFRAVVRTNEQGTDNQNPADVILYAGHPGIHTAPHAHARPFHPPHHH